MPSSGCKKCADRKSTRLNSSHTIISYAVFCLKKKKQHTRTRPTHPHARAHTQCTRLTVGSRAGWRARVCPARGRWLRAVIVFCFFFLNAPPPPISPLFPPPPPFLC